MVRVVARLLAGIAHEINNPLTYLTNNQVVLDEHLRDLLDRLTRIRDLGRQRGDAVWIEEVLAGLDLELCSEDLPAIAADNQDGLARIAASVRDLQAAIHLETSASYPVDVGDAVTVAMRRVRRHLPDRTQMKLSLRSVPPVTTNRGHLIQAVMAILRLLAGVVAARAGDSDDQLLTITVSTAASDVVIEATANAAPGEPAATGASPGGASAAATNQLAPGRISDSEIERQLAEMFVSLHDGRVEEFAEPGGRMGLAIRLPLEWGQSATARAGGRGTSLPPGIQARVAPWANPRGREHRLLGEIVRTEPGPAQVTRPRLLLIDDDPLVRRALHGLLGREYAIVDFDSGRDALDAVRDDPSYVAVLYDVQMNDLDGTQFYLQLGEVRPELCRRVVFISGGVYRPEIGAFLATHRLPVIDKVSPETLVGAIRAIAR